MPDNQLMSLMGGGDAPQGMPGTPGDSPPQAAPEEIAKGHEMADQFLESLTDLAARPPGQLTKQDVFQSAAGLIGKGLFADPQARAGLVQQLTSLPSDETALRQALGREIMQIVTFKQNLDAHAAQGVPQGMPGEGAPPAGGM